VTITLRARWGLYVAVAVAGMAVVPAPAQAEAPHYTLSSPDRGVSQAGKWFDLTLRENGAGVIHLEDARLVIDTADVAEFATAWVPSFNESGERVASKDCTTAGSRITCELGIRWSPALLPYLFVQAKEGAEVGRSGHVTVTLTAKSVGPVVATPKVTVADDVDLAVSLEKRIVDGEPGKRVAVPIEVTNKGTKPVKGAVMRVLGTGDLEIAGRYTNCEYSDQNDEVFCRFDEELAASATYVLSESPLALQAEADTTKNHPYSAHLWTRDDADEAGSLSKLAYHTLTPGTSGVLRLVRKPAADRVRALTTDSNGANNIAFGAVKPIPAAPGGIKPTATAPSASASAAPALAAGGSGGGLPVTGVEVTAIAGAGAALLGLGGVGYLLARRRRTRFVA
jgi:hypothetical protein